MAPTNWKIDTRENRQRLLDAADALSKVEYTPSPKGRVRPKGNGMHCGACGQSPGVHAELCPVHRCLSALNTVLPPYADRAAWLAEGV